jgi:hypothetical protein
MNPGYVIGLCRLIIIFNLHFVIVFYFFNLYIETRIFFFFFVSLKLYFFEMEGVKIVCLTLNSALCGILKVRKSEREYDVRLLLYSNDKFVRTILTKRQVAANRNTSSFEKNDGQTIGRWPTDRITRRGVPLSTTA